MPSYMPSMQMEMSLPRSRLKYRRRINNQARGSNHGESFGIPRFLVLASASLSSRHDSLLILLMETSSIILYVPERRDLALPIVRGIFRIVSAHVRSDCDGTSHE